MAYLAEIDPDAEPSPLVMDRQLAFSQPANRNGLAYWQALRGERAMPARRELRPRAMRDFLDHVNLIDVIADGEEHFDYAVSLEGARARDVFGHMVGRRLGDMLPPRHERRWRDTFEEIRSAAAPFRITTRASTFGKKWLLTETLLAPLGDEAGIDAIFWVFAYWRDA